MGGWHMDRDEMGWNGTDDGVVEEHVEFRWMASYPTPGKLRFRLYPTTLELLLLLMPPPHPHPLPLVPGSLCWQLQCVC